MDPKKQDCLGHYLYGAGYFAQETNSLGFITGNLSQQPHYCLTCPKVADCENEHEKMVREAQPDAAEQFDRRMMEGRRRSIPPTVVAVFLAKHGKDPFALQAVENFNRGHADRGRQRGSLVQ